MADGITRIALTLPARFSPGENEPSRRYEDLNADLRRIGLAQSIFANRLNDVAIELCMGLGEDHLIPLLTTSPDVGFRVSQILPVLVVLRARRSGALGLFNFTRGLKPNSPVFLPRLPCAACALSWKPTVHCC